MLTALIVDDEKPARERLRRLVQKHDDIKIIGEADNGLMALEKIERLKPDMVFLDIEMPELDGVSVAEALVQAAQPTQAAQPEGHRPHLIFITAFQDYALKAFEVSATDYLLKPIVESRLAAALARVRRRSSRQQQAVITPSTLQTFNGEQPLKRLAVRCGAKFMVIDTERISAIIARDHYAAILIDGKEVLADDSLDVFVNRLDTKQFLRVHRSAIVNLDTVKELEREGDRKFTAVLSDSAKTRIPISRERLDEIRARFGIG